jgi:spore coat polysaccharide biosynthesis protein SpsF
METLKIIIITQVRLGSTRFPEKVLEKVGDSTLLQLHLQRIKKCKLISGVIIATTQEQGIEAIGKIAEQENVGIYHGSTHDVLDRFYQSVKNLQPDYIVRVTSDCPLIDPVLIDEVIQMAITHKHDYTSNTLSELFPDGQDVEVISWRAFEMAWKEALLSSEREHVTPYIRKNCSISGGNLFTSMNYSPSNNYNHIRMTVDEPNDLEAIKVLINHLGTERDWQAYADYIINNPENFSNQKIKRNEGYLKSIEKEKNIKNG